MVSVASVNALRTESPEAHYNATKAGIVAIMRSFANELGHLGLRFNCVAPGETVSAAEAANYTDGDLARTREYLLRVPLRRVSRPDEQARVVLFLASDDASYVNGAHDRRRRRRAHRRLVRHRPPAAGARAARGLWSPRRMSKPLDDVDRRIIDQLQEEGRRPYTEIARAVGLSEAGVRQRVASLTERGVIQIVAATSPGALGMIQSFISVRVAGAGLEQAAERIAAIPEVDYVAVCTGPTDLLVGAVCRDNQHLLEVVTGAIREVPGVVETDTAVVLSELKDSYRWSDAVRSEAGLGE